MRGLSPLLTRASETYTVPAGQGSVPSMKGKQAQGLWPLGGRVSLAPSSRGGHTPAVTGGVPFVLEGAPQAPTLPPSACTWLPGAVPALHCTP